ARRLQPAPGADPGDAAIVAIQDGQQAMVNEPRVSGKFPRLASADSGDAGRVRAGDYLGRRQVCEQRRDSGGEGLVAGIDLAGGRGQPDPAVGGLVEPVERPGPGEVPAASRVGAARGGPGQELGLEQAGGGAQRDPDVLSASEAGTGQQ